LSFKYGSACFGLTGEEVDERKVMMMMVMMMVMMIFILVKILRLIFSDSLEFVELNYTKTRLKIKLLSINLCM
jgi:hypothetical protein